MIWIIFHLLINMEKIKASLFNNLNINDLNENESEGDYAWFKQPLKKIIFKRADNTDILKNEKLNKINKKVKKRKTIYPEKNSSDEDSPKKFKKVGWLKNK